MCISDKNPMTIQYEIKSQLAKLLATEDLVVEHKKVETASFNVVSRVLTLPMWENTSEQVVDMLVSHEVGHALYTPSDEWYKEYKINPNVVNVVEDARIEKLMKRRYDGITKTFYKGYTELHDQDFFQVKKKDITKLTLADRINLFYKIGSHYRISFTDYEQTLVDRVGSCETFQDVLEVSKLIYEYCLDEIEKRKQEQETEQDSEFEMEGIKMVKVVDLDLMKVKMVKVHLKMQNHHLKKNLVRMTMENLKKQNLLVVEWVLAKLIVWLKLLKVLSNQLRILPI